MMLATIILILSTALFLFFLQVASQRILRRQFDREYFQSIADVNRFEFPSLRESLEEFGLPGNYSRLRMMLKCDFLALTYLLKNAANVNQRYSHEERLLILYFQWQFLSLAVRHLLRVDENKAILKLTSVLQYFANVVGQRVNAAKFGNLTASDYLLQF
jgi:hypothetical protein